MTTKTTLELLAENKPHKLADTPYNRQLVIKKRLKEEKNYLYEWKQKVTMSKNELLLNRWKDFGIICKRKWKATIQWLYDQLYNLF
jgi:hypothetical protein